MFSNRFNNIVVNRIINLNKKKDLVILEAGSAEGTDTRDLAITFPTSKIYSFEPFPVTFSQAKELVKNLPNVTISNLALGEENKKMTLYLCKNRDKEYHGSHSLAIPKLTPIYHEGLTFPETTTVDVVNLNDWCNINKISQIDFLWLDLQGYEYKVLKTLSQERLNNISFIFLEVNFIELYEDIELFNELNEFLCSNDFVYDLNENFPDAGNYLYVKNNIIEEFYGNGQVLYIKHKNNL